VDAPGFVSKKSRAKHDLESSLFYDPYTSVKDVDIGRCKLGSQGKI